MIKKALFALPVVMLSAAPFAAPPAAKVAADPLAGITIDVPATKFVLPNGLTLIVHEDHSAPLVAVNIWYHVGSKNEPKGRSGFAHLFEHLMFNGSENYNDDFFKFTQKIGASEQNGTTSEDRTNYFQTVPKGALDSILWLESDRMGHLLGAIDQAKLDEQRKVVKNEKRQGDNKPYAIADDLITRATTPLGHPYDHSVIGSMADLDAASLDDVKDWFKTYYGPSNAVLVLAGDITPAEAKAKVEKYFGDIQPGAPVAHPQAWVAKRTGTQRETAYDRVSQPRLYRVWNISEYTSSDTDYLQFVALVLAGDKNARLYKRLVMDEQLATDVGAEVANREISGQFYISVDAKPGQDLGAIEKIVDEELHRVIEKGPTPAEMARLRTSSIAAFVRGLERIGGFSGKTNLLAESQTYYGTPEGWRPGFERFKKATPADLQAVAKKWLTDGDYVLRVLPFGELSAAKEGADRKTPPLPETTVPATFPSVERATLSNGLKLVVARRAGVPLVNMTMVFDTGTPKDFASIAPGTGPLAMAMLDEGTTRLTDTQLVEALGSLGASLKTSGGGEYGSVSLSVLKPALGSALDLYAEVITRPSFPQKNLDRLKAQTVADIAARQQNPSEAAKRLTSRLVFGADNAYGQLMTSASVQSIGRSQIAAFHERWFRPNNATLVVTGDTRLAQIRPLIEAAFKEWKPGAVPETLAPIASGATKSVVYLLNKEGTPQTVIRAALVAPPQSEGDEIARQAFNTVLGGSFTSRLNMKLREEKGWAYGAGSGIGGGGRGSRLFFGSASVQADKSAEAMSEIVMLFKGVTSDHKIDAKELLNAKDDMTLGLASEWSTSNGIASYILDQVVNRLPDDYYQQYAGNITAKSIGDVDAAGSALLANRPLTWLVVGDLAKIEADIRKLNLGEVKVIDADGNVLR